MGRYTIKVRGVECDACGEFAEEVHATPAALWRALRGFGWRRRGERDLCPACAGTTPR